MIRRSPNPDADGRGRVGSLLPGLGVARTYRREWLHRDVVAGLVLTALLVPQGMAYAELAGLPAVTGLYATVVPLIAYALFGPSRILVLGPDSALAPLVAAAVIPVAGANASERVAVAGLLALMVAGFLLVGSIARLGFLADLLSKPVRLGYLTGIALIVIASQLPRLLGVPIPSGGFVDNVRDFATRLDRIDTTTAVIGIGCLTVVLVLWRVAPTASRNPVCRRGRRDRGLRPRSRRCRGWIGSPRASVADDPLSGHRRSRSPGAECRGNRTSCVRRYERSLAQLCRSARRSRRPESRAGGPFNGQPRNRVLPGLSDLEQLVANSCRRGLGEPHAVDGRRRGPRGRDRPRCRHRPAREHSDRGARRRGDRCRPPAHRHTDVSVAPTSQPR